MLDYVVKITKDATRCSPADHDALRAVGFDDRGILQITTDHRVVQLHQSAWRMRWESAATEFCRSTIGRPHAHLRAFRQPRHHMKNPAREGMRDPVGSEEKSAPMPTFPLN